MYTSNGWPCSRRCPGKQPVGVKRVGALKTSGKHRSRLVAEKFNNGDDPDMHDPTRPLEGVKILLTMAAAGEGGRRARGRERARRNDNTVLMHIDVHRAYFNTHVHKDVVVESPGRAQAVWQVRRGSVQTQARGRGVAGRGAEGDAPDRRGGRGVLPMRVPAQVGWRRSSRPWG